MSKELIPREGDIIFYTTPDGAVHIEVFFQDETFWLSQKKMSELFGVEVNTINYHLKEIFNSKELDEEATIRKIRIVQKEGVRNVGREVEFYNLDAIIAVGYRVNSYQATQFRIWATRTLREFAAGQMLSNDSFNLVLFDNLALVNKLINFLKVLGFQNAAVMQPAILICC